jgi:thioredoxin 1
MKKCLHSVLALVGLLGLLVFWPAGARVVQASATPQGKPALYEFGAGYCVSCKEMAKIMAELKPQYGDQLEVRMVYADKEKDLFHQYKIMLIPTQVFLDASGKEVDRHIGALSKEEVIKKLKALKFIR